MEKYHQIFLQPSLVQIFEYLCPPPSIHSYEHASSLRVFEWERRNQSPTLGAHNHAHGFWVGMGAILMFMGGHRFCASLHSTPNRSQTSWMQGIC